MALQRRLIIESAALKPFRIFNFLPIYGCLTGVSLVEDKIDVLPGITIKPVYVDTISTTMMAFSAPLPNSHHPTPWVAVKDGGGLKARAQIRINDISHFNIESTLTLLWLATSVLRLSVFSPVRLAVFSNISFDKMRNCPDNINAIAYENTLHQLGDFQEENSQISDQDIAWLRDMLPVAGNLYHDEQFFRAYSLYYQAQWASTPEMAAVLIWTAVEILFGISEEQHKAKAISRALSDYVGFDKSDADRAYSIVRDLYFKRGRAVHAGHSMSEADVMQSFRLARVVFRRVLIDGGLPARH